jgi:hypothetical protein
MLFARGNDIVVREVLLEHEPLHLHVVSGVAPVAFCVEVAQVQAVLGVWSGLRYCSYWGGKC